MRAPRANYSQSFAFHRLAHDCEKRLAVTGIPQQGETKMTSRIQDRETLAIRVSLALTVMIMIGAMSFGTSAQQTLFTDDFEDGNANGWSKSGGSWTVVSDGSLVYRQSSTSSEAKARAGATSWTNYSVQA